MYTVLVALAAGPTSAGVAAVDLSSLAAAPNVRLGLAFPGAQTRYYRYIADAGLGVVRLSVSWGRIEPRSGRFDWSGLDERVIALQAAGIEPFLTFESDAEWATKQEMRKVRNAAPKDLDQWQGFVRTVVERYDADGRDDAPGLRAPVRWYQVANEWESDSNRSGGWVGSGADLVAYVNAAYDATKAADPESTFVLGGIAALSADVALVSLGRADIPVRQKSSATSETVLTRADILGPEIGAVMQERVLPLFRNARFDMADVHLYGPEDRDAARIALVRDLSGKPVLSSECGGPSLDYGGSYTPEGHFLAVVHRNLGVLASDAAFCLWFRLGESDGATYGNRHTALYDGPATPKPGVFAYRMLARLIAPTSTVRPLSGDGFVIRQHDGSEVRLAWGSGSDAVRGWAREGSAEAYCLADAASGILIPVSPDADVCRPDAFVVAGADISRLLAP